jgi:phosphate transport system substrate-binding protein
MNIAVALRRAGAVALLAGLALGPAGPSGAATASTQLLGGGESWPEYTVRQLENDAANGGALGALQPVYIAGRGEDAARADVAAGTSDFAVSSAPLTADELTAAGQSGITTAYVPFASGAVAIVAAVQADHQHGGGLIQNIKLTIPTLAKIFTHHINYWNDPEILAENPDVPDLTHVEVPAILTAVRRDSSSTSSALVAAFLTDPAARTVWAEYVQGLGQAPDITPDRWPADPNGNVTGVTSGTRGMINALLNLDPASGQPIPGTPAHAIGYVAPEFAHQFGAPLAAIQNRATPPSFVLPTAAGAVGAALAGGAAFDPATGLYAIDYTKITTAGAYPIPLVSYLVVPVRGVAPAKAQALASFIRFVLGTAGQADVASTGMVGVSAEAIAAGLKVAHTLETAAAPPTTTTTTRVGAATTTTTATAAVPQTPGTSPVPAPAAGPTAPAGPGGAATASPAPPDTGTAPPEGPSVVPVSLHNQAATGGSGLPLTGGVPHLAIAAAGLSMLAVGHHGSRRRRRRP